MFRNKGELSRRCSQLHAPPCRVVSLLSESGIFTSLEFVVSTPEYFRDEAVDIYPRLGIATCTPQLYVVPSDHFRHERINDYARFSDFSRFCDVRSRSSRSEDNFIPLLDEVRLKRPDLYGLNSLILPGSTQFEGSRSTPLATPLLDRRQNQWESVSVKNTPCGRATSSSSEGTHADCTSLPSSKSTEKNGPQHAQGHAILSPSPSGERGDHHVSKKHMERLHLRVSHTMRTLWDRWHIKARSSASTDITRFIHVVTLVPIFRIPCGIMLIIGGYQ